MRQTGHRAVVVHDFHQCAGRVEAGKVAEVNGGLGVAAATQHAVVLGVEGVHMTGTAEGRGGRRGVGQRADGSGTVVGTHSGGAPFQLVDGDGEGGAEHGGVLRHLAGQVEFLAPRDGDGGAEHAAGVFEHEVHFLGGDLLGGDDEVALVLAVFIVDDDDELPFPEVFHGVFYAVDDYLFHIIIM